MPAPCHTPGMGTATGSTKSTRTSEAATLAEPSEGMNSMLLISMLRKPAWIAATAEGSAAEPLAAAAEGAAAEPHAATAEGAAAEPPAATGAAGAAAEPAAASPERRNACAICSATSAATADAEVPATPARQQAATRRVVRGAT